MKRLFKQDTLYLHSHYRDFEKPRKLIKLAIAAILIFCYSFSINAQTFTKTSNPAIGTTVNACDIITYTLTATNDTGADIIGASISDPIPTGVNYVVGSLQAGATTGGDIPSTISPTIDVAGFDLLNGESITIVYQVQIPDPTPTGSPASIVNTATFNPSGVTATTTHPLDASPQISVTKSGPAEVCEEGTICYTINIANTGTSTADDVVFKDPVPNLTTLEDNSIELDLSYTSSCLINSGNTNTDTEVNINLGDMPVGANATIKFCVQVESIASAPVGTIIENVASACGANFTEEFSVPNPVSTTVTACPCDPTQNIVYFSTSAEGGNDATAAINDPTKPYSTWAAAVGAANAAAPGVTIEFVANVYTNLTSQGNIDVTTISGDCITINGNGNDIFVSGASIKFAIITGTDVVINDLLWNGFNQIDGSVLLINSPNFVCNNCEFHASEQGNPVEIGSGVSTFNNSLFANNPINAATVSAGAMDITGGVINLNNTDFICNERNAFGGAIDQSGNSILNITNGSFAGNLGSGGSGDGGAINLEGTGAFLNIDGTEFTCNWAEAGTGDAGGGAIRMQGGSTAVIDNAIFSGNTASNGAGSISAGGYGGAINISSFGTASTLTLTNSSFIGNKAARGGALYIENGSSVNIDNCFFAGNEAQKQSFSNGGGAIFSETTYTMTNSTVIGNWTLDDNGGGLEGGAVNLMNSVICGNTEDAAPPGGSANDTGGTTINNNGGNDVGTAGIGNCAAPTNGYTGSNTTELACNACPGLPTPPTAVVVCAANSGTIIFDNCQCPFVCSLGDDAITGANANAIAGTNFNFTITEYSAPSTPADFTYNLLVVNSSGVIVDIINIADPTATPTTSIDLGVLAGNYPPGDYNVYGYSYETADAAATPPASGSNISTLNTNPASCAELSDPSEPVTVLEPVLLQLSTLGADDAPICSYNGVEAGDGRYFATLTVTGGYPQYASENGLKEPLYDITIDGSTATAAYNTEGAYLLTYTDGTLTVPAQVTSDNNPAPCSVCTSMTVTENSEGEVLQQLCSSCLADAGNIVIPTDVGTTVDGNTITICHGDEVNAFNVDYTTTDETDPGTNGIGNGFDLVFILADNTGEIIEFNNSGDFSTSTLSPGTYDVFTLSYDETNNTPMDVDTYLNTLDALQMGGDIAEIVADDSDSSSHGLSQGANPISNPASLGDLCLDLEELDADGLNSDSEKVQIIILPIPEATVDATTTDPNLDLDLDPYSETICSGDGVAASLDLVSGDGAIITAVNYGAVTVTGGTGTGTGGAWVANTSGNSLVDGNSIQSGNLTNATSAPIDVVYTICPYNNGPDANDDEGNLTDSGDGVDDCVATIADQPDSGNIETTVDESPSCFNYTLTVLPAPEATVSSTTSDPNTDLDNSPYTETICTGNSVAATLDLVSGDGAIITAVNYGAVTVTGGTGTGTGGAWLANTSSNSLTNGAAVQAGSLTNATTAPITVTYTICPFINGADGNSDEGNLTDSGDGADDCVAGSADQPDSGTGTTTTDGIPSCFNYSVIVNPETPTATVSSTAEVCSDGTGDTAADETLTLSSLITAGETGGTWSITTGTGSISAGVYDPGTGGTVGQTDVLTYTISGAGPNGNCADRIFNVNLSFASCALPGITIDKDDSTPGTVDTDGDDTQTIVTNGTADFTITISNTGGEPLCDITVGDANSTACAQTIAQTEALIALVGNFDMILDPNESFSFTCQEANVPANFTNTAIVNANGCTTSTPVDDEDDTEVIVVNPEITIDKDDSTPGTVDTDGDDTQTIVTNGTADFTITVSNSGTEPLCDITVGDANSTACAQTIAQTEALIALVGNFDNILDPNESFSFTCQEANVPANFTNTAIVNANGCTTSTPVDDEDDTEVIVVNPEITVDKDDSTPGTVDTDGDDTQTIVMGGTADFTITVSNSGTEPMCDITVGDANSTACAQTIAQTEALIALVGNFDNILDPNESFTFTCQEANVPANFTNTAIVNANGCTTSTPVDDEDDTEVIVVNPEITVDKDDSTPGTVDTDGDDTQTIALNGTADFTITVSNSGTEPLCDITVGDANSTACTQTIAQTEALIALVGNFDNILDSNESFTFTCQEANVPANFTNTAIVNANGCTTSTPIDDEDDTEVIVVNPEITVDKDDSTPGTVDTDGDDTQTIVMGGTADFTITVSNSGTEPMCDITVGDANSTACAQTIAQTEALIALVGNFDMILDPNESFSFTCQEANVPANFTNTAIVNANGCTTSTPVDDEDDTEVIVVNPEITIDKDDSTPGTVDTDGDDTQTIPVNGTADFTITVSNSGTEPLCDITVGDANSTACTQTIAQTEALIALVGNFDNILDPNESFSFSCQEANVPANFINTAIVNANGCTTSTPVDDEDDTEVIVVNPEITVDKDDSTPGTVDTDGDDTQTIVMGGTADFTITVSNSGTEPMCDITVGDANSTACAQTIAQTEALIALVGNFDMILDPNESFSFTCQEANVPANFTNTAIVNANGCTTSTPVDDEDDTEVIVVNPEITIDKDDSTPGTVDTDGDDTQTIALNGTADFTITVSNSGTEPLCDITVGDANSTACAQTIAQTEALIALVGNFDMILDPNESFSFTCQEANVPANFTNTAIVNANGCTTSTPVDDEDDTEVIVVNPEITIDKDDSTPGTVDTDGDDTQTIVTNGTADFTITVSNSGTEPLCDITVGDANSTACAQTIAQTEALIALVGNFDNILDSNESFTFTCQEANVPANFTNTAIVNANGCTTSTPVDDEDDTEVIVVNPEITVDKDDSTPGTVDTDGDDTQTIVMGGTADFTITVSNSGTEPMCDITVGDANSTACAQTIAQTEALIALVGNFDNILDPNESFTFTCQEANVPANFTNTAIVNANGCTTSTPVDDEDDTEVIVVNPEITVDKDDSTPGTVDTDGDDTQTIALNGTADFTITVSNSGTEPLCDITVGDANSTACAQTIAQTEALIALVGNFDMILDPNESFTFTCQEANVPAAFTNTAIVNANGCTTGTPVDDEDDTEVILNEPVLEIVKGNFPEGEVCIGGTITYTLTVTNITPGPIPGIANNVVISDMAPVNTTFVSGSTMYVSGIAPLDANPATPNWVIPSLLVGESTTVSFDVTVNANTPDEAEIPNIGEVTSFEIPDPVLSNEVINIVEIPTVICRQPVSTISPEGECGHDNIILLDPYVIGDNCAVSSITNDAPDVYPTGTTTVLWTVEFESGLSSTCEQDVTILDNQPPVVPFCNTAIVMLDNNCLGEVTVNLFAEDNCGVATIEGNGTFTLPLGIHPHQIIVTDVNGNSTVHNMTIYVHDTSYPVVTSCPDDVVVSETDLDTFVLPIATFVDNCGVSSIVNNAPDAFELGTTTVTWTGMDDYGNQANCSYDVIIVPAITIGNLRPIAASVEDENETATVRWNAPIVNTICAACPTTNYDNFTHIGDYYGHQYFLYTGEAVNWETANYLANTELNAHLANIGNLAENNFVRYHLPTNVDDLWIGLQGSTSENGDINLDWTNDSTAEFQNFGDVFALTETQNVVTLQLDGGWAFANNTDLRSFIVERPCINIDQIGPYVEVENEAGEIEEVLLTSSDEWAIGEYLATYRAGDDCGHETIQSFPVSVDVPVADYCASAGTDATSVWIKQSVIGGDRNNEAEEGGYKDHTDELIDLDVNNNQVYVELLAGGNTTNEDLFWRIWLDKNNDGDFFDADEMIFEKSNDKNYLKQYLSADLFDFAETRLRIAISKYDYPEVCNDFHSGEVEDYLVRRNTIIDVNFGEGSFNNGGNGLNDTNVVLSPNPTDTHVNIELPELDTDATLEIYNTTGQLIKELRLSSGQRTHTIDVKDFSEGLYILDISTDNAQVQKKLVIK